MTDIKPVTITYPLEVYRQSPLQLICAHPQNFKTLLEVDIWVMVLVEDRKAVVSVNTSQVCFYTSRGEGRLVKYKDDHMGHTEHSHEQHTEEVPTTPSNLASKDVVFL